MSICTVLKEAGFVASTSEARRLITQGAVEVEGQRVLDVHELLSAGRSYRIKVGKRRFRDVRVYEGSCSEGTS